MRSMRQKLDDIGQEKTEWVKVTSIPVQSSADVKKNKYGKQYFFQLDADVYDAMMDQVSPTANKIARLMIRELNYASNIFCGTYEEIQKRLEANKSTVESAMIQLGKVDFMRRYKNGRWMVNPAVGIKCEREELSRLLDFYNSLRLYTPKPKRKENEDVSRETERAPEPVKG